VANELVTAGLTQVSEKMVGQVRVEIFASEIALHYQSQNFKAIELLLYPDKDISSWDHAELVSDMTLEEILEKYPDLK
jgi:predicted metalloenzyme YecM